MPYRQEKRGVILRLDRRIWWRVSREGAGDPRVGPEDDGKKGGGRRERFHAEMSGTTGDVPRPRAGASAEVARGRQIE